MLKQVFGVSPAVASNVSISSADIVTEIVCCHRHLSRSAYKTACMSSCCVYYCRRILTAVSMCSQVLVKFPITTLWKSFQWFLAYDGQTATEKRKGNGNLQLLVANSRNILPIYCRIHCCCLPIQYILLIIVSFKGEREVTQISFNNICWFMTRLSSSNTVTFVSCVEINEAVWFRVTF
jgi:hypothetical protein